MHDGSSTGELDLSAAERNTAEPNGLSGAELAELADLLRERRRGDRAEAERLAESLGSLLASRSESTSDDEHDPEGPTLSSEWSRLQALRSDSARDVVAVDTALARIEAGTYGVCSRCGEPIGVDRLRARPTAELCIRCAVSAEH